MKNKRGKGIIVSSLLEIFLVVSIVITFSILLSYNVSAGRPYSSLRPGKPSPAALNDLSSSASAIKSAEKFYIPRGATIELGNGYQLKNIQPGSIKRNPDGTYSAKGNLITKGPPTEGTSTETAGSVMDDYNGIPEDQLSAAGITTNKYAASGYEPYKVPIIGTEIAHPIVGHLVKGLFWSIAVVGAIQLIGGIAGFDKGVTKSLSISAFGGIMSGQLITGAFQAGKLEFLKSASGKYFGLFEKSTTAGFAVGAAVAAAIFIATYKKEKKKLVSFQCLPFEPMIGGAKC